LLNYKSKEFPDTVTSVDVTVKCISNNPKNQVLEKLNITIL